ncbi:MAG: hypothetical protein DRG76_04740 [Deltaproteobacteria bacterium]|nr:MAG: hypothetical protein DRG76_04740 [Deltaproteobacteria bacterium]
MTHEPIELSSRGLRGSVVAGIILAAGTSSRMGVSKQLLPIGGVPLICHMVSQVLSSHLDRVVMVLGHDAEKMKRALLDYCPHPRIEVVVNPEYPKGMASSIKRGLKVVQDDCDHVMIILADMLHIDARLINILLKGYLKSGRDLGAIRIQARRSHPVIFSRRFYPELQRLEGDVGGRSIFEQYAHEACFIDAPPTYREMDLDTPEDYRRYQSLNWK